MPLSCLPASFKTTRYHPFTPIAFLLLIVILLVLIGVKNPRQALSGLLVLATGLLVYELFLRGPRWIQRRKVRDDKEKSRER